MRFELHPVVPTTTGWVQRNTTPPPVVLEFGEGDAVSVTNSNSGELVTSALLAQVTAAPANYQYMRLESLNGTQPLVVLDIPGFEPLKIGARSMGSNWGDDNYRYVWRDRVRIEKQPTHELADTEWLALVTKFGLSTLVTDEVSSGRIERRERFNKAKVALEVMLVLFVIALAAYLHFAR